MSRFFDFGERFHGTLCNNFVVTLVAAETVGDESLIYLFYGKQHRNVDMRSGKRSQSMVEQKKGNPLHDWTITLHGPVSLMPRQSECRFWDCGTSIKYAVQLAKELTVFEVSNLKEKSSQCAVNQPIGRAIDAQLVMRDSEMRLVRQMFTQLFPKNEPPSQVGQVSLKCDISPRKTCARQKTQIIEKLADEDFMRRVMRQAANAAIVKRFRKPAPTVQHTPKNLLCFLILRIGIAAKVDLRKNFNN